MKTNFRDFVMEITSWSPVNFYKNNWIISVYPNTKKVKITINNKYQELRDSLVWNIKSIQLPNLFENMSLLFKEVWLPNTLSFFQNENCDYASPCLWSKNSYLSFWVIWWCENVLYSYSVKDKSVDILNSVMIRDNCSIVYDSIWVFRSYKIFSSDNILDSNNIYNSSNLQWCSFCINCNNLTNQSYFINNKSISKEEYDLYNKNTLWIYNKLKSNFLIKSENIDKWFLSYQVKNSRNIGMCWSAEWNENLYDTYFFWSPSGNDVYAVMGWWSWLQYWYCSHLINGWSFVFYSIYLESCSFCLGCIWLKNKSYCILNKQYTKEEWYEKVDEIFGQMDADGTLGEFFPACMNPFYFNDTAAYLIDPSFTKEEVTAKWYLWRDEPIKVDIPETAQVISIDDLDQYESFDDAGVWKIDASILKKVIQDHEGNVYTIQWLEYNFLVKHGLPLPRKHWLDRMKENFRIS